jgi:ectoine hydroxylase-related dioxygenase (phytanoyl-CoA dioxygenase family)
MRRASALSFHEDGAEIRVGILRPEEMEAVRNDIDIGCQKLRRHGVRHLEKRFDSIARLASAPHVLALARELLGKTPRLVRALYFDKTASTNWFVAWHQDKTVALSARREMPGWGPWSLKEGVHHVQPPCCVLDQMVTIRLHIDAADEASGCLHVMRGSHRHGILHRTAIERWVAEEQAIPCVVDAGDAVVMRPHVLHASRKSQRPLHRRVVHLEYSSYVLPSGIEWG